VNPRSITDEERPWLDAWDDPTTQLHLIERARALDVPYANDQALALAGYLAAKAGGLADETSAGTRSKYRRLLRSIGAPSPNGGRRRKAARTAATLTELRSGRSTEQVGDIKKRAVALLAEVPEAA